MSKENTKDNLMDQAKLIYALICMVEQYILTEDGRIDHCHMTAGEMAEEVLEKYGYVSNGRITDFARDASFPEIYNSFLLAKSKPRGGVNG